MTKLPTYPGRAVVTIGDLQKAIVAGENETAVGIARALTSRGVKSKEIIVNGVTKAMEFLDKKCTIKNFCLLELMLAGRAAMDIIDYLSDEWETKNDSQFEIDPESKKRIILGTIKGDIHEIGKNIFSMLMRSYGYEVFDQGKDVDPDTFVSAAIDHQADYIGISSLITTTIPRVKQVRKIAVGKGLGTVKVIAGGAALSQSTAEFLNVDYVAVTVFDGLHYIDASES